MLQQAAAAAAMTAASLTIESLFSPPQSVRGLKKLDKSLFEKRVRVPAVALEGRKIPSFRKYLSEVTLGVPGVKCIKDTETEKVLLLSPLQSLTNDQEEWIKQNGGNLTTHEIHLEYKDYSLKSILQGILQCDELPLAYETIGHIAHYNLKEHHLPFKHIIGEALLSKVTSIKTVVNKTDTIDETFRTFQMELLAGEDNTVATVTEGGCQFTFDFSKVYWNSRLSAEHARVVDQLKRDDIVLDMFAGVGPFSVPSAKKGCVVYANDLNPYAYSALLENSARNGVTIRSYNLDGIEFVEKTRDEVVSLLVSKPSSRLHVIMNLPALAYQFINCFKGYYNNITVSPPPPPIIHCYIFSKSPDPSADVLDMVEKELGVELVSHDYQFVRKVAPNKSMMRVTFPYPSTLLWNKGEKRPLPDDGECESGEGAKRECFADQ